MYIDHRHLTICQKQHRQNEPAHQVDVTTKVEVRVTGDPDLCRDHRCLMPVKNYTERINQLVR